MINSLGKHLEGIRAERKLSLREVSELCGLSYTYIRDIELGVNRKNKKEVTPSPSTLKKLADAYKVDYYGLLEIAGIVNEREIKEATAKISTLIREERSAYSTKKSIPLIGTICAGDGLLAESNIEEYIYYPFIGKRQPDYALRVKGDSMVGAGIEDGDIVYMRDAQWADYNGQIVAAVINDDQDGTIKRMKWSEGSPAIRLTPENESYKTIEAMPNEIRVCGVYMGHFKPVKGE
jgi:repressor LexA